MTNPVTIERNEVRSFDEPREVIRKSLLLWCPGCDDVHRVVTWQATDQTGPVWTWDGNLEAPTIDPSILVKYPTPEPHPRNVCHSYLRAGRWEFLSDCTHQMAGQTVDMVPLPDRLVG